MRPLHILLAGAPSSQRRNTLCTTTLLPMVAAQASGDNTANQPDITIVNSANKVAKFMEISVPLDDNLVTKMADKIIKYRDLEIACKKCKEFCK
eukprot:191922-Ditylum_brightwellii.AAC.1